MSKLPDEQIMQMADRVFSHFDSKAQADALLFARDIITAHEAAHRVNNPAITMVGCSFTGFNADGSEPFIYSEPDAAGKQTLTAINLIAWTAQGPISADAPDLPGAKLKTPPL